MWDLVFLFYHTKYSFWDLHYFFFKIFFRIWIHSHWDLINTEFQHVPIDNWNWKKVEKISSNDKHNSSCSLHFSIVCYYQFNKLEQFHCECKCCTLDVFCLLIWIICGEFVLFILQARTWTKINVQYNQKCRHFNRYCKYLFEGHIEHFLVCSTTISSSWFHWREEKKRTHDKTEWNTLHMKETQKQNLKPEILLSWILLRNSAHNRLEACWPVFSFMFFFLLFFWSVKDK